MAPPTRSMLSENSRILHPSYLEKSRNKKDLIRRLTTVVQVLRDDDSVEAHSPEWPGLAATAALLVQSSSNTASNNNLVLLHHADKQVRLLAVTACLELLAVYCPAVPFDDRQLLDLFGQLQQQLANLAHTVSDSQPHFMDYVHLLRLLATVKIGAVLTELVLRSTLEDTSTSTDDATSAEPLQVLTDFIHTLLHAARREHPTEVLELMVESIGVCLEEYGGHADPTTTNTNIPIKLLDELLLAVGQGPTVWVTQLVTVPSANNNKQQKQQQQPPTQVPQQVQQPNPTHRAATAVIRSNLERLATPMAHLLNGLLCADPTVVDQSSIPIGAAAASDDAEDATTTTAREENDNTDGNHHPNGGSTNMDVYRIVYELHRVSPTILTTVIGTVAAGLVTSEPSQRLAVTRLLGQLFAATVANPQPLAVQYAACYRDWLQRQRDVDTAVRRAVVQYAVQLLPTAMPASSSQSSASVSEQAQHVLRDMILNDPAKSVRLLAMHELCDLVFNRPVIASSTDWLMPYVPLLQAVATRVVNAKDSVEHMDALTGLAQIYARHVLHPVLKPIQTAGDNCPLEIILQVLQQHLPDSTRLRSRRSSKDDTMDWRNELDNDESSLAWIPRLVFQSVSYADQVDPDMRNRVYHIVDNVLLGSDLNPKKTLSATTKAVGWVLLESALRQPGRSNNMSQQQQPHHATTTLGYKRLQQLFRQRAVLQQTLHQYLEARAQLQQLPAGTEEALRADAHCLELLETVVTLTAPVVTTNHHNNSKSTSNANNSNIAQQLHSARDRHIFRILGTICTATHSPKARQRALDELPKRTKHLGALLPVWIKQLVRRVAMGSSMNQQVIGHVVLVAHECFRQWQQKQPDDNDDDSITVSLGPCTAMLQCVQTAAELFPDLTVDSFGTLTELLTECRHVHRRQKRRALDQSGIVTALSAILSVTAASGKAHMTDESALVSADELEKQLIQMVTRDGTPEQAWNAVHTLSRLFVSSHASDDDDNKELETKFSPLLQSLTSPLRMTVEDTARESDTTRGSSPNKTSGRSLSVLSSLAALAECAPGLFGTPRGETAVTFALETVIMGRGFSSGEDDHDDESEKESSKSAKTPSSLERSRGRSSAGKHSSAQHLTPQACSSLLEDESLSLACRRLCAAMEFLVSYIRSTLFATLGKKSRSNLSLTRVKKVFELLVQFLQDKGLAPSNRDRRLCRARQDRAALRQCAAVHILRLCDPRLGLDKANLTPAMWHTFSQSLLDEERVVREAVIAELVALLMGTGMYGLEGSKLLASAPSLRFVSLICMCSDGDHGSEHDGANGNAANIGKLAGVSKSAVLQCIVNLRKASDATYAQCRATGKEAEQRFETRLKMVLMPEYAVPYCIHLLSLRHETPFVAVEVSEDDSDAENDSNEEPRMADDASRQRVLRKRLKLLLEPLVQSLGESADNISFLLRMVEIIGKMYRPVDVSAFDAASSRPSIESPPDVAVVDSSKNSFSVKRASMLQEKLKTVCGAAREVLLSFVKKDVNLTTYPGTVQLPASLFVRLRTSMPAKLSQGSSSLSISPPKQKSQNRTPTAGTPGILMDKARPNNKVSSRVHFSPDVVVTKQISSTRRLPHIASASPKEDSEFGNVSPIASCKSPASLASKEASEANTLGTTPPSTLRGATLRSTAPDDSATSSPSPPKSQSRSSVTSSQSPVVLSEISRTRNIDDEEEDEGKTTSETQSQTQSTRGCDGPPKADDSNKKKQDPKTKRKKPSESSPTSTSTAATTTPSQEQQPPPRRTRRRLSIPKQINIDTNSGEQQGRRSRRGKATSQSSNDDDFSFAVNDHENRPVRRNRPRK